MQDKSALITGGAGFIGLHLARKLLAEGYRVDLLDNFSRGVRDSELEALAASDRVGLVTCDVLDAAALQRVVPAGEARYERIFHFAAIIGVANVLNRPYEVLRDNTLMLANMIACAKAHPGLKRLLFTSTSEVYAGTLRHFTLPVPTPESTPLAITDVDHPRTSYMLSKIYGEAMLHQAGVPFTIIRPHNFYGPRMGLSHVVPELLKKAYAASDGGKLDVASTSHRRAFCYIEDAVEIAFLAATLDACLGRTLNVGNQDVELSIGELASVILDVTGKKLAIAAGEETPGSPSRRCPDMTLTTQLTGYRAKVGLREGVQRTFDWYKKNVFDGAGISAR
jgi:nucleoside-diphosphate-sugar epimerase